MSEATPAFSDRRLGLGLTLGGVVGVVASLTLLIERIMLAEDADYVPSCSLNPVLSCGSVMESWQASVFGFPNPILGVVGFSVLTTIGVVVASGAALPRWFWLGLQAGVTLGLAFVLWLIHQSLYRIGALCPYCMVVWATGWTVLLYLTLHNAAHGVFGARVQAHPAVGRLREWHAPILVLGFVIVLALITDRFWDYWSGLV